MAGRTKKVQAEKAAVQKKTRAKKQEEEFITELDQYLFGQGTHYDIFKKLGAHMVTQNGKKGTHFAVWAPNAKEVFVIGSFNGWDEESYPMKRLEPLGIYAAFVPGVGAGELYKFLIHLQIMPSFVRVLRQGLPIFPDLSGLIPCGWRKERVLIRIRVLFRFMRYIREAGKSIHMQRMRAVITTIGSLHMLLLIM